MWWKVWKVWRNWKEVNTSVVEHSTCSFKYWFLGFVDYHNLVTFASIEFFFSKVTTDVLYEHLRRLSLSQQIFEIDKITTGPSLLTGTSPTTESTTLLNFKIFALSYRPFRKIIEFRIDRIQVGTFRPLLHVSYGFFSYINNPNKPNYLKAFFYLHIHTCQPINQRGLPCSWFWSLTRGLRLTRHRLNCRGTASL